jgi:hypothetical protein
MEEINDMQAEHWINQSLVQESNICLKPKQQITSTYHHTVQILLLELVSNLLIVCAISSFQSIIIKTMWNLEGSSTLPISWGLVSVHINSTRPSIVIHRSDRILMFF